MTSHDLTPTPQDEALLAILDGADPFADGGGPVVERQDLETLALLGRSVPPVEPRDGAKAKLFARLNLAPIELAEGNQGQDSTINALPGAVVTGHGEGPRERVLPFQSQQAEHQSRRRRTSPWLPLALAAAVLLAVGLGTWSGFLFAELEQSRTLVAGLESELDTMQRTSNVDDYRQVMFENQRLRSYIGMATQPKTRVCAMSAMAPNQPNAKAAVLLRPEEGQWVIATNNLAKCELGRRYRLWFLGEDGTVMGGEVLDHITGEQKVELASGALPTGTAALLVTLEFPDQFGQEPGGERVLYGDRAVEIY